MLAAARHLLLALVILSIYVLSGLHAATLRGPKLEQLHGILSNVNATFGTSPFRNSLQLLPTERSFAGRQGGGECGV